MSSPTLSPTSEGQLDGLSPRPKVISQCSRLVQAPTEIQLQIVKHLPYGDFAALSATCRALGHNFAKMVDRRHTTLVECVDQAKHLWEIEVGDRQKAVDELLTEIGGWINADRPLALYWIAAQFDSVPQGNAREASALRLFSMVLGAPLDHERTREAATLLKISWLAEGERAAHFDALMGLCEQVIAKRLPDSTPSMFTQLPPQLKILTPADVREKAQKRVDAIEAARLKAALL